MCCRKTGLQFGGVIQILAFCIQIGIAYPVVEIFKSFFITPEKVDALRITASAIIISSVVVAVWNCFYKIHILFIISLDAEYPVLRHFLIIDNIVCCFGIA